jgi:hypothetical protein
MREYAAGEPRELGFRIKPKARPVRRLRDLPPWAQKVVIGLGVVAFYFAARALNRYRISFAARDVAIEALIPLMGLDAARTEAGRQHGACFDQAFHTKWGKWQDFSFDERTHADCVVREVMKDIARRNKAAAIAARGPEPPRRPRVALATPWAPPPAARIPAANVGRVVVGNVKVVRLSRSPQLSGHLTFVAIGNADALAAVTMCSYAVTCDDQPQGLAAGQRALAPCALRVQGAKAEGEMDFLLLAAAPAGSSCVLDLTLTDATRGHTNAVVVPLS